MFLIKYLVFESILLVYFTYYYSILYSSLNYDSLSIYNLLLSYLVVARYLNGKYLSINPYLSIFYVSKSLVKLSISTFLPNFDKSITSIIINFDGSLINYDKNDLFILKLFLRSSCLLS